MPKTKEQPKAAKLQRRKPLCAAAGSPRLYEISALVQYNAVILARSEAEALKHVETWEHAWDANADLIGVSDVEIVDVRNGTADDAHDVANNKRSDPAP